MLWGAFTLLLAVGGTGIVAYSVLVSTRTEIDQADSEDVAFVLNLCGLGEHRIERVLHSYVSPRSFTGDHVDAYAIKVSRIDLEKLTVGRDLGTHWYCGDSLPPPLSEALAFIDMFHHTVSWLPHSSALRGNASFIYPSRVVFHGGRVTAAELIFARPLENTIFYFSAKT